MVFMIDSEVIETPRKQEEAVWEIEVVLLSLKNKHMSQIKAMQKDSHAHRQYLQPCICKL